MREAAVYLTEHVHRDRVTRALAVEPQPAVLRRLFPIALTDARQERQIAFVAIPVACLALYRGFGSDVEQDRQVRLRQELLDLAQPRRIQSLRLAVRNAGREIPIADDDRAGLERPC